MFLDEASKVVCHGEVNDSSECGLKTRHQREYLNESVSMKLFAIHIARCSGDSIIFMAYKYNISSFGYLERKPIRELGNFLSRQIVPKIHVGTQEIVTHHAYRFYAFKWSDGLCVSALADHTYPSRIIFELLEKIHNDFREKVHYDVWSNATTDGSTNYKKNLEAWIMQYKNPLEFDAVSRVMNKVEETKDILRKNIEQVLGNREQVEKLLRESEDVSTQSEMMFKAAKKANKGCCRIQ